MDLARADVVTYSREVKQCRNGLSRGGARVGAPTCVPSCAAGAIFMSCRGQDTLWCENKGVHQERVGAGLAHEPRPKEERGNPPQQCDASVLNCHSRFVMYEQTV